jgi:hypothetical protein
MRNGQNFNRKPERGPLGGLREYNIEMDLNETRREDVNWIHLTQDRDQWRAVVNTVMYRHVL